MCFWLNFPSLSLDWSPHCLSNISALWEVEVRAEGDEERAALWKWWAQGSLPFSLAQAQLFPHFQAERRAGRGDFYFPGDRDIVNYLPFPATSCQWIGQRKSTDRISPYPSTLLMGSLFNCRALSTGNTNYINYAPTQRMLILAVSRLVTF